VLFCPIWSTCVAFALLWLIVDELWTFRFRERMFHIGSERSKERKFPGTFVLCERINGIFSVWTCRTLYGIIASGNEKSWERKALVGLPFGLAYSYLCCFAATVFAIFALFRLFYNIWAILGLFVLCESNLGLIWIFSLRLHRGV